MLFSSGMLYNAGFNHILISQVMNLFSLCIFFCQMLFSVFHACLSFTVHWDSYKDLTLTFKGPMGQPLAGGQH